MGTATSISAIAAALSFLLGLENRKLALAKINADNATSVRKECLELLDAVHTYMAAIDDEDDPFKRTRNRQQLLEFLDFIAHFDLRGEIPAGVMNYLRPKILQILVLADVHWPEEEMRKAFRHPTCALDDLKAFCIRHIGAINALYDRLASQLTDRAIERKRSLPVTVAEEQSGELHKPLQFERSSESAA